MTIFE